MLTHTKTAVFKKNTLFGILPRRIFVFNRFPRGFSGFSDTGKCSGVRKTVYGTFFPVLSARVYSESALTSLLQTCPNFLPGLGSHHNHSQKWLLVLGPHLTRSSTCFILVGHDLRTWSDPHRAGRTKPSGPAASWVCFLTLARGYDQNSSSKHPGRWVSPAFAAEHAKPVWRDAVFGETNLFSRRLLSNLPVVSFKFLVAAQVWTTSSDDSKVWHQIHPDCVIFIEFYGLISQSATTSSASPIQSAYDWKNFIHISQSSRGKDQMWIVRSAEQDKPSHDQQGEVKPVTGVR